MLKNHPRGLMVLFFTEMWERFGYYLMLGIFFLYMTDTTTGGLGLGRAKAADIVGTYLALVYLTPFIGGLLADRILGYRLSIFIGGAASMILPILIVISRIDSCNYTKFSEISGVICLIPFVIVGAVGGGLGGVSGKHITSWLMELFEPKKAHKLGSSIGLIIAAIIGLVVSLVPAFLLAFPNC